MFPFKKSPVLEFNRTLNFCAGLSEPSKKCSDHGRVVWLIYQAVANLLLVVNLSSLTMGLITIRDIDRLTANLMTFTYLMQLVLKIYLLHTRRHQLAHIVESIEHISFKLQADDVCYARFHASTYNRIKTYGVAKGGYEVLGNVAGLIFYSVMLCIAEDPMTRRLPGEGWFPYDYHFMPQYLFSLVMQTFGYMSVVFRNAAVDVLFLTLVLIPSVQLQHLRKVLGSMFEENQKLQIDARLSWWIQTHQQVLGIVEDVASISSLYLMINYAMTTLHLFLLGFILLSDSTWDLYLKIAITPIVTNSCIQLYLLCVAADSLMESGRDIGNDAYTPKLMSSQQHIKKTYLFIVTRASKVIRIMAGGINPLSSRTFAMLMNATFSYFVTILQIKGRQDRSHQA